MSLTKSRHIINYAYRDMIKKRNTIKNLKCLRKTQWFSKKQIKKYQWKKLVALLKYAKKNVPYYSNVLKDKDLKNFSKNEFRTIPFLNKSKIQKNFDSLISRKYLKSDLIYNSTSGSTGEKLKFFNDKKRIGHREAIKFRNWEWTGIDLWDKKVKLWGLHLDTSKSDSVKAKLSNWMKNIIFLSAYDLTKQSMEGYRKRINKTKPKLIISQPSVMYTFSKFIGNCNKPIHKPKAIILSAETLYPYQRKTIETTFNCKIYNRYGSREFGDMVQECEEHIGLHIYSERVYLEIVNKDGEPCEPGELGEIVVTDLDNYGFPFIRYKIGDMGIKSDEKCECGRGLPLLKSVEGRTFDIVVCPNGNYLAGTFWTILLRERIKGIDDFKLIQKQIDKLNIKLVTTNEFNKTEKEKLLNIISNKCGEEMRVEIIKTDALEKTKSGKKRFIISEVNPFE